MEELTVGKKGLIVDYLFKVWQLVVLQNWQHIMNLFGDRKVCEIARINFAELGCLAFSGARTFRHVRSAVR